MPTRILLRIPYTYPYTYAYTYPYIIHLLISHISLHLPMYSPSRWFPCTYPYTYPDTSPSTLPYTSTHTQSYKSLGPSASCYFFLTTYCSKLQGCLGGLLRASKHRASADSTEWRCEVLAISASHMAGKGPERKSELAHASGEQAEAARENGDMACRD